jgi:hypothetical protein
MATQTLFTPGTAITNGEAVNATVTNRIVNSSGGVNDTLLQVSGYRDVLTGNSNQTVTANYDVCYYCNNTTNITITLPPASTQLVNKNIRIIKIGNNTATVTVQRQALSSDVIGNPYSLISVPVDTSFVIYLPNESYEWNASGNVWYALNYSLPVSQYRCEAYLSADQNLGTGTFDRINLNTEVYDFGSFYDNVTNFRATPLIPGLYGVWGSYAIRNATATDVQGSWRKNTTRVKVIGQENLTGVQTSQQSGSFEILMNGTTDYIEMRAYCGTASGIAFGGASDINTMGVRLISRI